MLIKPLSVAEVKGAKAAGKDYSLHDGFGLLLHVSKAGGKVWRFRYQHPDTKKRQTLTIGPFPEFTLAEAREARDNARRLVVRGIDPNEQKRAKKNERMKRKSQSFGAIAEAWFKVNYSEGKSENTVWSVRKILDKHVLPAIGDVSIHDISASDVINKIKYLEEFPNTLKKSIFVIRNTMDFSVISGVIASNPLGAINKAFKSHQKVPQKMLPLDRLPEFIKAWEGDSSHPSVINAVKFMILTMARPGEAMGARWNEIDMVNKLWVIPPDRMKMRVEHAIPLSEQALFILKEMEKIKKGDFIFYSPKRNNVEISKSAPQFVLNKIGFFGDLTFHGFRSMWSTLLNEEGFNPDVIEAALAHKSGGGDAIRGTYNRAKYLEHRRVMMQYVGDFYDSARKGIIERTNGKRGLKVVNE